jgi:hypothetical protein
VGELSGKVQCTEVMAVTAFLAPGGATITAASCCTVDDGEKVVWFLRFAA